MTTTLTHLIDVWQQPCDPAGCGDLVLVEQTETTLRVVLVDACGHGPRAAAIAEEFERVARPTLVRHITAATFRSWNRRLCRVLAPGEFVAVTAIEFNMKLGCCTVWNSGNPAAFRVRREGRLQKIEEYGLPLGAFENDTYEPPAANEFKLLPGDALVALTDGLLDQRSGDEPFGEERLRSSLCDATIRSTQVIREIERAVEAYRAGDGRTDDTTVVVLRAPAASAGWPETGASVAA